MKILLSMFDREARTYGPVFSCTSRAEGLRQFGYAVLNPECPAYAFPSQFELHELGTFDDMTGIINNTISFVMSATTVKTIIERSPYASNQSESSTHADDV